MRATESIVGPALLIMSGRALGFVATFAIPMVLVRLFDPDGFGTYKQLFLLFSTFFVIAQVGMAESLYYFLPGSRLASRYILNTLLVLGMIGVICLGLMWFLRTTIAGLLNNESAAEYVPHIGVYLLLMLMAVVVETVMIVRKRHLLASCSYAAWDILRTVFYLLPVVVFGGLRWLMIGAVAFALTRFVYAIGYLKFEFRTGLTPDAVLLRKQMVYALPFGAAALIEILHMNFHMYAVSWYFDPATFAIYAVGCLQIPVVLQLVSSTANVMMVQMRENLERGYKEAVLETWLNTTRKLMLMFCLVVGGLLVVADELIVLLFTHEYQRSVPIFMLWTASMLIAVLLTDAMLRVYAQTRFLIVVNLLRLGVVVALIPWFLAHYGLMGAVLANLLAAVLAKAVALARVGKIMNCRWSQLLPWRSLGAALTIAGSAALVALMVKSLLTVPGLASLLITSLVYGLTYYFLVMLLGPVDSEEKLAIARWTQIPVTDLVLAPAGLMNTWKRYF